MLIRKLTQPYWRAAAYFDKTRRENVLLGTKPYDHRYLPPKFDLAHSVAFYFHDQIGNIIRQLESAEVLNVSFKLAEDERNELKGLSGDALWQWLKRTGRQDVINDLTYRQLLAAVLADACQFLGESLIASGKGKTTVAYSLLRKPFKESLLLIEWLCADPEGFLARFHGESIDEYVLNRMSESERRAIMRKALNVIDMSEISEDVLWLTRYDKNFENSLETLWTKATHLVTTVKASATQPGNLNFVFSSQEALEEQWEHYYRIVPFLLYYFLQLADFGVSRFVPWEEEKWKADLLRQLAFVRYAESGTSSAAVPNTSESLYADLAQIRFLCRRCGGPVHVPPSGIDRLWLRSELLCSVCCKSYDFWNLPVDV